jgi:hypothetical protein
MLASQHEVGNIPEERQAWRTRGKIPPIKLYPFLPTSFSLVNTFKAHTDIIIKYT